ncbi:MAG: HD domain-containing protein [Lachnospiraceae bacterium]|nr:HD domain-containing protein [Lachnospiraceae bacterium]
MITTAYGICLIISIIIWIYMTSRDNKNTDSYYSTGNILIPIIILGYWLKTTAVSPEAAMFAFCIIYFDSTVLLTFLIFAMLRSIGIKPKTYIKFIAYSIAFIHLFIVWMNTHNDLYFKKIRILPTENGNITKMTDGPFKIFHTIYILIILVVLLAIIIAGYIKKGTYSLKTLTIYTVGTALGLTIYGIETVTDADFSLLPFLYVLVTVFILINHNKTLTHDVSAIVSSQQVEEGSRGYIILDLKKRFISCNKKSYEFMPELADQRVDQKLRDGSDIARLLYSMITSYEKHGINSKKFIQDDKTCICEIEPFFLDNKEKKSGYIFDIRDATEEQHVIDIMTSYNESLNRQVKQQTENILDIQRKIVTGMANMIENRDNNTGGHVKRTSDILSILIDEIKKQGTIMIDDRYALDIVRAAPMHDLGKISIENSILNKPGKLTDEEFTIMKSHSTKSGEMVMILLEGVEEEHFVKVAYNVARYHHERWDGRGYPENLVGSMIPLEARIMAVVDVYDALVSKRSYKAEMSFDQVSDIMLEGMGTQFDPNLRSIFLGCKKRFEEYYLSTKDAG